ncbi:Transposon Ty3-I Gag-Pol polyprotein [Anthophora retusa]
MTLKSPSGRLARWALQLQPYNITIKYAPGKSNVVADTLSRPPCTDETIATCPICIVSVDLPSQGPANIRQEQLLDPEVRKIIETLENGTPEETTQWATRGYLLSQGVLYRYTQDDDSEEAQLVVPAQERINILKEYHDAPTAGHYGIEHTLRKIRRKYYWPGMRTSVIQHVKTCLSCQRYKASNLKPAGLLQTPTLQQRFEVVAIDLFGPLPPGPLDEKWILILEDYTSRWVELFALTNASAETCAWTLVNEVFLRYGIPRRLISDNGIQFVSSILQQITYCLDIDHKFTYQSIILAPTQ